MAVTAPPVARPGTMALESPLVAFERRGIGAWLTTPDHKKIGIMYMISTFVFFLLGGLALLPAAQRAWAIRPELVAGRGVHSGGLVDPGLDELPGHHPEHAHARHDHAPHTAVRLGDADHLVYSAHRDSSTGRGAADG